MKWAAVAVVAAALLTGGCNAVQGDVVGNAPAGDTECKGRSDIQDHRNFVLTIKSSANHIDQDDPNKSWVPTYRTVCVDEFTAKKYPVGSRYAN